MTAKEKNESDLATLMDLQSKFDAAVASMNDAAKNSTDKASTLVNDTNEIFNKYPV